MKKLLFHGIVLTFFLGCSKNNPQNGMPDVILPPDATEEGNGEELTLSFTPCENGMAGEYPCNGYDLLGRISLTEFGAQSGNDIWGWTDATTGKEYALMGLDDGTAFVDISDTENLKYLGKLSSATSNSAWRDIKVYRDFAFIVSEASNHGMQIFDLTRLRSVVDTPQNFEADMHYTGFGNCHNIVINEVSGFAYPVGTARDDDFNGGAHFIDIHDPLQPVLVGGYGLNGYSHDAQVVTYSGPDPDYIGAEIFIGANESTVVIINVTNKDNPIHIASLIYPYRAYTHQGWFTEDQRYFLLGDELDEINSGFNSRTLIFDFSDLDNPMLHTTYLGATAAIDHNGYVKGDEFYLANYTGGIRVLDISGLEGKVITEKGYFDTFPTSDVADFNGVWSVYPYFESGKIIVSDINRGLFVVKKSE